MLFACPYAFLLASVFVFFAGIVACFVICCLAGLRSNGLLCLRVFPMCFSLFFRAVIYCLLGALLSGVVASLFRLSLGSLFCFRSCALFVDCFVDFACACFLLCAAVLGVFLLLLAVCACVLASVFACLHVLVECLLACACGFLAGLFVFVGCFCGLLVCLLALLLAAFLANVVPTYKFLVGFRWEIVGDGRCHD